MVGPLKITLLTHRKEFGKRSNTGQVVAQVLGDQVERMSWERLHPPPQLLAEIAAGGVALVYPGSPQHPTRGESDIRQFVVIDGTWLTARRIYQRSPYLHQLPRVSLRPLAPSRYNLRNNQKVDGLCTAECVVELLSGVGLEDQAQALLDAFLAFQKPEKSPTAGAVDAAQPERASGTGVTEPGEASVTGPGEASVTGPGEASVTGPGQAGATG